MQESGAGGTAPARCPQALPPVAQAVPANGGQDSRYIACTMLSSPALRSTGSTGQRGPGRPVQRLHDALKPCPLKHRQYRPAGTRTAGTAPARCLQARCPAPCSTSHIGSGSILACAERAKCSEPPSTRPSCSACSTIPCGHGGQYSTCATL